MTSTDISSNTNKLNAILYEQLSQAGQFDLSSHTIIRLSGPDAQTFLQGQVTSNINEINEQQAGLSAICNNKGRAIAVFILAKHQDDWLLILPNSNRSTLLEQLQKYGHFSKVDISIETSFKAHIGVISPEHPKEFPEHNYQCISNSDYLIIKLPGVQHRFEMIGRNSQTLTSLMPVDSLPQTALDRWHAIDIAIGTVKIEDVATAMYTPHMLNLTHVNAISFTKGCYIGQEIIARTEHKGQVKRSTKTGITHGTTNRGDNILDNGGNPIGTVFDCSTITNNLQLLLMMLPVEDASITLFTPKQEEILVISNTK